MLPLEHFAILLTCIKRQSIIEKCTSGSHHAGQYTELTKDILLQSGLDSNTLKLWHQTVKQQMDTADHFFSLLITTHLVLPRVAFVER